MAGGLPGIDGPPPSPGSLTPDSAHTPPPMRKPRSMVNMVSASLGYLNRSNENRAAATSLFGTIQNPSASGSPSGSPSAGLATSPGSPRLDMPSPYATNFNLGPSATVKAALQDFLRMCKLTPRDVYETDDGGRRFPLLRGVYLQKKQKLASLAANASSSAGPA